MRTTANKTVFIALCMVGALAPVAPRAQAQETTLPAPNKAEVTSEHQYKVPIGAVGIASVTWNGNSDYPGPFKAMLTEPVYSADLTEVIFPYGTWIHGHTERAKGENEAIHNRLIYVPTKISLPDGSAEYDLPKAVGLDLTGIAGLQGKVDYHLDIQAKALLGYSALNSLPEILQNQLGGQAAVTAGTFIDGSQDRGNEILEKYFDLVPTVETQSGDTFVLYFGQTLSFPSWKPVGGVRFTNVKLEDFE